MSHIITISDLKPGDVLLGISSVVDDEFFEVTGSHYSHAAIYLGRSRAAHADAAGVEKVDVSRILDTYRHLVVLRNHWVWDDERVKSLHAFVDKNIAAGAKFNKRGFVRFKDAVDRHQVSLTETLHKYFDPDLPEEDKPKPPSAERFVFFCSEFVAACFIAVGIVYPTAAFVHDPAATSPSSLIDATYGSFAGYLVPYDEYKIPEDDQFRHVVPFNPEEI